MSADDGGFTATLIELIDELAAADPRCRRFGAPTHRWQRRPVLAAARVAAIEAAAGITLPEDYRSYLCQVGDGGAGPYHGVLPLDRPAQLSRLFAAVALADLGCDQVAVLAVDGPDRGRVWADVRALDPAVGVVPLAASFTDFFAGGLAATARGELPPAFVAADRCILPRLLSALLAEAEQRLGVADGTLAGDDLRAVLAALPPGGITIASVGTVLHDPGDPIAPCVKCAVLVDNLAAQGLASDVLAPPRPARPLRDVRPDVRPTK